MSNLISQNTLVSVDPTEGLVQYAQAVKPYHTKLLEVLVEYVYKEDIKVTMSERWNWDVYLTQAYVELVKNCGFGVVWDNSLVANDYPVVGIVQAVGETPIEVSVYTDPLNPTHVTITYNPNQYDISIGTPITFQTVGISGKLPNTTTGPVSPGRVYYVTSKIGDIIEISPILPPVLPTVSISASPLFPAVVAPAPVYGPPLVFVSSGDPVYIHLEGLEYNSFLVEPAPVVQFQCIATNVVSNQLTFVNAYNITGVNSSQKKWTVPDKLLSSGYQTIAFGSPRIGSSSTGLLSGTTYTSTVTVDGVNIPISVPGLSASTFTDLLVLLNGALGGAASASLLNGNIIITSSSVGYASTINITDTGSDPLFASITFFDAFAPYVNETVAIPGNALYVSNNTGTESANKRYTIQSAILSGSDTIITTVEAISILATATGFINIQDDINTIPNWVTGTKVKLSTNGILPTPLSSTMEYYYIPSADLGHFNLAKKAFPTSVLDYVDITSMGTKVINIERTELFYPGAVVSVSNSYLNRNDTASTIEIDGPDWAANTAYVKNDEFVVRDVRTKTFPDYNNSSIDLPVDPADLIPYESILRYRVITPYTSGITFDAANLDSSNTILIPNKTRLVTTDQGYFVSHVKQEGSNLRVYVNQPIRQTTPLFLSNDGYMTLVSRSGYDYDRRCSILQADDLYTDATIGEKIMFEFELNFNDEISSNMIEDLISGTTTPNPLVYTSTQSSTHTLLPMGYDVQYLDIGVLDEDLYFDNSNLGNSI